MILIPLKFKSLKKASYSAFRVLLISQKPPCAVLMAANCRDSGDKFCPLSEGLSNCRLWGTGSAPLRKGVSKQNLERMKSGFCPLTTVWQALPLGGSQTEALSILLPRTFGSSAPLLINTGCRTQLRHVAGRAMALGHFPIIAGNGVVVVLHGLPSAAQSPVSEWAPVVGMPGADHTPNYGGYDREGPETIGLSGLENIQSSLQTAHLKMHSSEP